MSADSVMSIFPHCFSIASKVVKIHTQFPGKEKNEPNASIRKCRIRFNLKNIPNKIKYSEFDAKHKPIMLFFKQLVDTYVEIIYFISKRVSNNLPHNFSAKGEKTE